MEQLRKAGAAIRSFDDAYSEKIRGMYDNANPAVQAAGYMVGGGHPSLRRAEPEGAEGIVGKALEYGIPAVNAVPKYVLPAAGVTLAGQGLYDLTNQFGGVADMQEPSQLSL